jgi:hypothetical protein
MKYVRHRRWIFDRPFFGAKVFIPAAVAAILAGVMIGVLRPPWYWAIALAVASVVVVFGAIIWRESRAVP